MLGALINGRLVLAWVERDACSGQMDGTESAAAAVAGIDAALLVMSAALML